jgi:hypothetical protein
LCFMIIVYILFVRAVVHALKDNHTTHDWYGQASYKPKGKYPNT